jgi:peptide/nickel transport system permease protein
MGRAEPFVSSVGRRRYQRVLFAARGLRGGDRIALIAFGVLVLAALLVPVFIRSDPTVPTREALLPPGRGGLLGSDQIGRDILVRVAFGMRTTLFAACAVIASGLVIGGAVGLIAGSSGGWIDNVFMRITDVFLALPGPILAIAVVAAIGPSLRNTLIAVAIVWWPLYARIMRGEVRALKSRPHLDAARLAGVGPLRRAVRHLLPGAIPPLLVAASLDVGALVLTLAGLSFLGLGSPAPAPELGAMVQQGLPYLFENWWVPIMPALGVFVLAFLANVAGDAVRNLWGIE